MQQAFRWGSWYLDINNRYFKSYKHFVGKEEQKHREEEGSNVINHSYETDISLLPVLLIADGQWQ